MIDGRYFDGVWPWNPQSETALRSPGMTLPPEGDPLARSEQRYTFESDFRTGVEAWDYQNPYVWQSSTYLTVGTLVPAYGVIGDTPQSVAANIARTAVVLKA